MPFPFYSLLYITGADSERFLQGQLTYNIAEVTDSDPAFCALCNTQGRVLASGWLSRREDGFLWILPEDLLPVAQAALEKYARFSAVTLTPSPSAWQVTLKPPSTTSAYPQISIIPVADAIALDQALYSPWQLALVRQGIALLSAELSGQFTPHELAYPAMGAISFNKGCYLGQEIIARMHYRGKLKKHLHHVQQTQLPLQAGQPLSEVGSESRIIQCAVNEQGKTEALLVANDAAIIQADEAGQLLLIKTYD